MNAFSDNAADTSDARPRMLSPNVITGIATIVVATVISYLPALTAGFVVDDEGLVTKNHVMQAPDGLYRIWFTDQMPDYWPITFTVFWGEYRLWGAHPLGYHIVNVVLHISEAILIWLILTRAGIPGAWLAGFLFAIHPLNVASVAWVSEMKNLVAMFFFLLAILAYQEFDERSIGRRRRAGIYYCLSIIAFLLALLGKGSVAVLPAMLLILLWYRRGLARRDLVRTVPFFVLAAAFVVLNMHFQIHASGADIRDAGLQQRLLGAGGVSWFYLSKALLPLTLLWAYPMWSIQSADWQWWVPFIAAALASAILWWKRDISCARAFVAAFAWFIAALVPVMGFTDVGFMRFSLVADFYAHIALIGVTALIAGLCYGWFRSRFGIARAALVAVISAVTVTLGLLTWRQCEHYKEAETFYRWIIETNPQAWFAEDNLGELLLDEGYTREAVPHLERALEINPKSYDAHINMGRAFGRLGKVPEAVTHLETSLSIAPKQFRALSELASLYPRVGRYKDAIAAARDAYDVAKEHGNEEVALKIEEWFAARRRERPDVFRDEPPLQSPRH